MAAIKITFFQECEEQLAELETGLLAMAEGANDSETVNAVFRAVHSIKGGAGAFGLEALVRFSHVFETTLDEVRTGRLAPEAHVIKVMLRAADVLADLVKAARDDETSDEAQSAALGAELAALMDVPGKPSAAASEDDDGMGDFVFEPVPFDASFGQAMEEPVPPPASGVLWRIKFHPKPDLYAKANDSFLLLRELGRLGTLKVQLDSSELPLLPELDPEGVYLTWNIELSTSSDETAIREVFEFVDGDCDLDIALADQKSTSDDIDILALIRRATEGVPTEAPAAVENIPPTASIELPATGPSPQHPNPVMPQAAPAAANVVHLNDAAAAKKHDAGSQAPATIRVDLDRVDRLIDLVGELVINQAMLSQRVIKAGMARASGVAVGLDELEQLTREIQDSVMAIRAQPVKSVFQRMPRLAREVAAMTGKQVRLVTEGEGTEVDKTVIERLTDPLTHMIRNAIDHGLEKPEARLAAGKPAEGVVRLAALHRSGRIVIEVADDGAGINRSKVREIAVERSLIAADAALTEEETDNLIFMPGFSTANVVSDISGRGVGMDVVKRSIQALGGRIAITSRPGLGSTFTMSLPLTLAVLDGMVVSVGDQTLVAPLTAIVETLKPKAKQVHGLGSAKVLAIRDSYVPLIDVGAALGYRHEFLEPTAGVALLIESEGGTRAALLVDDIQGQRQVVIKSLEANYRHVPGIAAATILGDGRVALILDIDAIVAASKTIELAAPELPLAAVG